MKFIKVILLLFIVSMFNGLCETQAQQKSQDEIRKIVESQNFIFNPETANPQRGKIRQLSSGYDLTVSKTSIISYLPFFGRAQTIPIGSDGGIKFTSTNFEYEAIPGNKGWQITIKPKDVLDVQQLYMTIYNDGNASLDVISINRDNISFSGRITQSKIIQAQ